MRADDASWPYHDPSGEDPDWTPAGGRSGWAAGIDHPSDIDHPSFPAGGNGRNRAAGDDSWPSGGGNWPYGEEHPSWPADDSRPAGWPYGEDHPSWPAGNTGPNWTAGDDSWVAGNESWTAGDEGWMAGNGGEPDWPYGEDHPSWPAGGPGGGGGPAAPRREPEPTMHHDTRRAVAPRQAPAGRVRGPATGGPDAAPQWAGPGDVAAPGLEAVAGNGPVQVLAPSAGQDWAAGGRVSTGELRRITGESAAEMPDPFGQAAGGFHNSDSVRLAERILSDADTQAAGIKQEALEHASAIREAAEREADEVRRQAAYQAESLRDAEREAEQIKRRAAEQADAIREAATREADELRAGAIRLSAELGQVAAYVTRTLTIPAIPAASELTARPGPDGTPDTGTALAAEPQARQPDAQPTAMPRPQVRPRPQARPRPGRVTQDLAGPAKPDGEPAAWQQPQAWEEEAQGTQVWQQPPAWEDQARGPQARQQPQPQSWEEEARGPQAWQLLEQAWAEEDWDQDGRVAEAGPDTRPEPAGRAATRPRREGRPARTAPAGRAAAPSRPAGRTARTAAPAAAAATRTAPAGKAAGRSRMAAGAATSAKGRQRRFVNRMIFAYVALLLIPLFVGITELALHGFPFFVFRNAGAAAGNPQQLEENQGPGQANDVTAHHSTPPATPKPTPGKTN
jgi:hypothetical protein